MEPGRVIVFLWKTNEELNDWRASGADNKDQRVMPKCFSTDAINVPQIFFDKNKTAVVIAVGEDDIKYVSEVN